MAHFIFVLSAKILVPHWTVTYSYIIMAFFMPPHWYRHECQSHSFLCDMHSIAIHTWAIAWEWKQGSKLVPM